MPLSLILPLTLFSFVAAVTPGPNNIMLASSGLTYGFRRTVPHMLGIIGGFMVMLLLVGLGLGALFQQQPGLHSGLQLVCMAYLLYLAWQIAMAQPVSTQSGSARPLSFLQAAGFQWVNPKAWAFTMSMVAVYVPSIDFFLNLCVAVLICGLTTSPAVLIWTLFGVALRRFLQQPSAVRRFNVAMALLLVTSLYPMLMEWLR